MVFVDNWYIDGLIELMIAGAILVYLRWIKKVDGTSKYHIETWAGFITFLLIGLTTIVMSIMKTIKEFLN